MAPFSPRVVTSRDGRRAILLTEFDGVRRVHNRDAVGFHFIFRGVSESQEEDVIIVVFSGMVMDADPASFGIAVTGNREEDFMPFAIAAIGDYLDVSFPKSSANQNTPVITVEAMSSKFEEWRKRDAPRDDDVIRYLSRNLFWTWKELGGKQIEFDITDALQLGCQTETLKRIAEFEDGRLWRVHIQRPRSVVVGWTPESLRTIQDGLSKPDNSEDVVESPAASTIRKANEGSGLIAQGRIDQLRAIKHAKFDLSRLIRLCQEINVTYANECYFATGMLIRAAIDHIPPVFGKGTFKEVANNHGGQSFKKAMVGLDTSIRAVYDDLLHSQISHKEILPAETRVACSPQLDMVLAEIVKVLSS